MSRHDFLERIIADKRRRLEQTRAAQTLASLRAEAEEARRLRARSYALRAALGVEGRLHIIAEIKRASPSKGVIRPDIVTGEVARAYEEGGAAAISILTEEDHFGGSLADLRAARRAVSLPLLRKDFIFDEYQLYEAASAGADALLLIVAALDDETLARLLRLTEDELGMDALVEVHTAEELGRAAACGARLIGVNNRDLRTFQVSLDVSHQLAGQAPAGALLISESGLRNAKDLRRLQDAGFHGFLIGETLMRASDPRRALQALLDEEPAE